jgi:hypothetical protein
MHFLYLDASGDPGWPPPYGKSRTKWYVLAGLSLVENRWSSIHDQIKSQLESSLGFTLGDFRKLRLTTILSRAPPYDQMDKNEVESFVEAIFDVLIRNKPRLFAAAVNKRAHYEKYKLPIHPPSTRALPAHLWALQLIAPRFHKYLDRIDALGIFVMDTEERTRQRQLQKLIVDARDSGIVLKSPFKPGLTDTNLPRLIESVLFVDSQVSLGVLLADFCSHAIWRKLEKGQDRWHRKILQLFDEYQGRVYGYKQWP